MHVRIDEAMPFTSAQRVRVSGLATPFTFIWRALATGGVARTRSRAARRALRTFALATLELVVTLRSTVAKSLAKGTILDA